MPGPAPTPTAMLTSWRAKKRAGEPQPPKTRPTCPTSLSRAAKKKFKEVVGWQESMGMETPVDRDVIVLFVDLSLWLEQCRDFLRKHGDSYLTYDEDGNLTGYRPYPEVSTAIKLAREVARLAETLGLSPSGRTRIRATPKETVSKVSSRPRRMEPVIFAPEAAR